MLWLYLEDGGGEVEGKVCLAGGVCAREASTSCSRAANQQAVFKSNNQGVIVSNISLEMWKQI